jgi:chromate transporter
MTAVLWHLARTFIFVSPVAIGGANAVIPEIHHQAVELNGWMTDTTLADLFAIAQAASGPNVLIVSLIGWYVEGIAGLVVATLAMILPSGLLALKVGRLLTRMADTRAVRVLKEGMVPVAMGLMLTGGVVKARAADDDFVAVAVTESAATLVTFSLRNPLWALAIGSVLGAAMRHLGAPG